MESSKITKIGLMILGLAGLGLTAVVPPENFVVAGSAEVGHVPTRNAGRRAPQVANIAVVHDHEDVKSVVRRNDEERRNTERPKVEADSHEHREDDHEEKRKADQHDREKDKEEHKDKDKAQDKDRKVHWPNEWKETSPEEKIARQAKMRALIDSHPEIHQNATPEQRAAREQKIKQLLVQHPNFRPAAATVEQKAAQQTRVKQFWAQHHKLPENATPEEKAAREAKIKEFWSLHADGQHKRRDSRRRQDDSKQEEESKKEDKANHPPVPIGQHEADSDESNSQPIIHPPTPVPEPVPVPDPNIYPPY